VVRRPTARPSQPFRAFIGYGDMTAVRRATSTIKDVLEATPHAYDFQPLLWPFDQLASAHWRERALAAARGADIVVLASSQPGELPALIEHWISALLEEARGRRLTLVAIAGASDAWTISIEGPPHSEPPHARAAAADRHVPRGLALAAPEPERR
jgi:hypothetical protein